METEVDQIKGQALAQAVVAGVSAGVTIAATSLPIKSAADFQKNMGNANLVNQMVGLANAATSLVDACNIKKISKLEAEITEKKAAMALTRSVANSVESSLKSIDSVRDRFMSMMTEIAQAMHDSKMQIIRNSAI